MNRVQNYTMNHREEEIPLPIRYYALHLHFLKNSQGKRVVPIRTILERTGISETSLYRIKKKWEKKRSLSDSPRRGRPSKISSKGDTRLKILASKTPLKSYREIGEEYNTGLSQQNQISLWTVKRHLAEVGILAFRPARKTTLEPRHIVDRFLWAREYRDIGMGFWESVVFCDETRILLNELHPKVKAKRPRNSRYDPKFIHHAEKYGGGSISFWGSITYWGPGPLYRLYGSMDATTYTNVLGGLKLGEILGKVLFRPVLG